MKTQIKLILITAILVTAYLIPAITKADPHFTYSYDAAGNRTGRGFLMKKPIPQEEDKNNGKSNPLKDALGGYDIFIYPNPTNGIVSVKLPTLKKGIAGNIEIFDVNGNKLYDAGKIEGENTIDLSKNTAGSYIMSITIDKFLNHS